MLLFLVILVRLLTVRGGWLLVEMLHWTDYAVGHELTEDTSGTTDTLVVGGNLTATNGVNVKNGNVKVGGTLNENYTLTVVNGTVSENTTAIDFGAAYTYLKNLSPLTQLRSLAVINRHNY